MTALDHLADLREHMTMNYTTDARASIAWAVREIEQLRQDLAQHQADCPRADKRDSLAKQRFAWVLYDGRAESGDTDDASVLEAFSSRRNLRQNLWHWRDHDGVLFEYDDQNGTLVNERQIGHLREGKAALLAKCSRMESAT